MPLPQSSEIFVKPKEESWQLDPSGLFFSSPLITEAYPSLFIATTTKAAGNMAEEDQRLKLLRRLDVDARKLALSYQVHGTGLHMIRQVKDIPTNRIEGVDGWIASQSSGAVMGIFTADCLPVFLLHKDRSWGALMHAGWRGIHKGILEEAVKQLAGQGGCRPGDLKAAVGPHIRACCYEVGMDLMQLFGGPFILQREGRHYLDLASAAASRLSTAGVTDITAADVCTRCSPSSLFYSYRRQEKGSQLSIFSFS